MRVGRARAFVAALGLTGCALFTSLDELSGGDAPADAGSEAAAADAAPADAPDLPASDGAAANVDAGPFCARADATFCEDWDDGAGDRWLAIEPRHGAVEVDTSAATSGSASLLAATEPLAVGENAYAYRAIEIQQRATGWVASFDLRLEQRGDSALVATQLSFRNIADDSRYHVTLVLASDVDSLDEARELPDGGYPYASWNLGARFPTGKWTRVTIEVLRSPNGVRHARVWSDAMLLLDQDLAHGNDVVDGTVRLAHGVTFLRGPSTRTWTARFDSTTLQLR